MTADSLLRSRLPTPARIPLATPCCPSCPSTAHSPTKPSTRPPSPPLGPTCQTAAPTLFPRCRHHRAQIPAIRASSSENAGLNRFFWPGCAPFTGSRLKYRYHLVRRDTLKNVERSERFQGRDHAADNTHKIARAEISTIGRSGQSTPRTTELKKGCAHGRKGSAGGRICAQCSSNPPVGARSGRRPAELDPDSTARPRPGGDFRRSRPRPAW